MTKPGALFLTAALIVLVLAGPSAPQNGEAPFDSPGLNNLNHSGKKKHQFLMHPQTMISDANERIKVDPKDFSAYLHRGLGYWASHDLDKATADIKKSIELNPARLKKKASTSQDKTQVHMLARAHYQLGCIYCSQKQYKPGIDELSEAITLAPDLGQAYRNRALAYQTIGEARLAQNDLAKAAQFAKNHQYDPGPVMIEAELANLAEVNSVGDDEDTARQLVATNLTILKEKDPAKSARLYRFRVSLDYKLGRYKQALADLDWLQANDTVETFWSTTRRRTIETLLQKYGTSKRDFDPKLFSNDPANDLHQANNFVASKKLDQAEALLSNHLKAFPNDAMAYAILYTIHVNKKQTVKAIDDVTKIITLDPTNRAVYMWRAEANEKAQRYKQAAADYSFVLSFDPKSEYTRSSGVPLDQGYFRRADAYRELHEFDQAIADYSSILKLEPTEEEAYRFRGDCYFMKGNYQQALVDYSKSISLDSRSAGNTYLARAKAYEALKRPDLAEKDRSTAQALSTHTKPKVQQAED